MAWRGEALVESWSRPWAGRDGQGYRRYRKGWSSWMGYLVYPHNTVQYVGSIMQRGDRCRTVSLLRRDAQGSVGQPARAPPSTPHHKSAAKIR